MAFTISIKEFYGGSDKVAYVTLPENKKRRVVCFSWRKVKSSCILRTSVV